MPQEEEIKQDIAAQIKAEALRLGFSACGIARATTVREDEYKCVEAWVQEGFHGTMSYLERNTELRRDPRLLLPGTRSLIMVAMNYYPTELQPKEAPQFAYYAYGRDYHKVVKKRLDNLLSFIRSICGKEVEGRSFADSAPLLERYWAVEAGLGWRGRHGLLIIPGAGSYFVLGALLINIDLPPDSPQPNRCGKCRRCLDACPTQALLGDGLMDARRCISYLTIEQSEEIPTELAERMDNRLYGCDACQEVCPWNRYAKPTTIEDFSPRAAILQMRADLLEAMTEEGFSLAFAGSPVKRAGLSGLKRSLRAIRPQLNETGEE